MNDTNAIGENNNSAMEEFNALSFKEKENLRKRLWREQNRDKMLVYKAKYRETHREELRAKDREYRRRIRAEQKTEHVNAV